MTRFIRPLASGVAALIIAGVGVLGYNRFAQDNGTYQVTAYFEKAIGLFENSDVDILGVPVGTITAVDPEGSRVKVVMEISDEYKVPADAFAQIIPPSVISDRYVQLHPVYEGGPALQDGAVLDIDRTQEPAELDDVFKQLKKLLEAIEPGEEGEPGALGELVVQLDETLKDREDDVRGTLIQAAELTDTLAGAEENVSGLLVNLEDVFATLATRANSLGTLNRNFATAMVTLAESRDDVTGTLANLAGLTNEVGDLVREHRGRLGEDLELALKITSSVLRNRASVEESLSWLPVVAEGLINAYHPPPVNATDVRDNIHGRIQCKVLDDLPPGPLKDELKKFCKAETGEPPQTTEQQQQLAPEPKLELPLNCDKGVRKVKRQIKKLSQITLPDAALEEVLRPLRKQLRELKKKCKELGDEIKDGLLDKLPDVGALPELQEQLEDLENLTGNAAGERFVPTRQPPNAFDRVRVWVGGFFGFLGWSS